MSDLYDVAAPKKPTNVSLNSDLLKKAKALGINLSQTLEKSLAEQVRAAEIANWQRDNAEAIKASNRFAAEHGTFSDSVRKF